MPRKGSTYIRNDHEARFLSKVRREGECWIWTADASTGYGRFRMTYGRPLAHRWSYEHFVGSIPEGLEIDHLCLRPLCVNPAHLEPVTPQENARRKKQNYQRRTICRRGHEVIGDNCRVDSKGYTNCRACARLADEARKACRC